MTQTYDHYAACHELAACLLGESLPVWHEKLENAIADGATSTEILMAIRFVLRDLLGQSPTMTVGSGQELSQFCGLAGVAGG
jgi:hypothetical protein